MSPATNKKIDYTFFGAGALLSIIACCTDGALGTWCTIASIVCILISCLLEVLRGGRHQP